MMFHTPFIMGRDYRSRRGDLSLFSFLSISRDHSISSAEPADKIYRTLENEDALFPFQVFKVEP